MSTIVVHGITLAGTRVAEFVLAHGADPATELATMGWQSVGVQEAYATAEHTVVALTVVADLGADAGHATWQPVAVAEQLPDGVEPVVRQRLGAYAMVAREGRILGTQLAAGVRGAGGTWTLPGGGIDPGEDPATAVRRETWEETGQHLGEIHLVDLLTSRWVGQAPDGTWEDYQVVRLIYVGTVPEPDPLVVHDVGGTTAAAAWLSVADLDEVPRAPLLTGDRWRTWLAIAEGRRRH